MILQELIHQLSDRRHFPFADLNCGAITASVIESELFGHESGAFTGASHKGKKRLFEIADKGTLFLDEIGEFYKQAGPYVKNKMIHLNFIKLGVFPIFKGFYAYYHHLIKPDDNMHQIYCIMT